MPNDSLTELLASYVPQLIQKRVIANPSPIESPVAEEFQAAVLFADISGFTALTERLAEKGPTGVEALARILNEYFGQLIDIIHEYGGDVVKFAGDAVIAVWPIVADLSVPEMNQAGEPLESRRDHMADPVSRASLWQWSMRAAECALMIRKRLTNYRAENENLYLKLAISMGSISTAHVGGVYKRWEFLLTGMPLVELGIANTLARAGEILIAPSAWKLIRNDSIAEVVEFELKETIAQGGRLNGLKKSSSIFSSRSVLDIPEGAEGSLRAYIPGAIINRLTAGQSSWIAELRRVTVLFINLPGFNQATQLETGQAVARAIQESVYSYEGSLNKINVDDKGITVVAALGLPPFAHEDDPTRGVQAALMIRKVLTNLSVKSYIGVATGRIFCGSVGNSARREYTMIGNSVNLSARLMGAAEHMTSEFAREKIPILCDRVTYDSAKELVEFEALPPQPIKGRSEAVEVFHPIEQKKRVVRPKTELIGRQEEKTMIAGALQELQRGAALQTIIFHGEAGIGKSRLTEELTRQVSLQGVKFFMGAGDSMEKNSPYFAWRMVFHKLFGVDEILSKTELVDSDYKTVQTAILAQLEEVDPGLIHYAPLLNVVLPLALPENELTSAMTGEVRGGNLRELLVRLLNYEAATSGFLIAMEDLHWLDSGSWALLYDVHEKVRPLLLVLNTRPLTAPEPKEFKQIVESQSTRFIKLEAMLLDDVESLVCQRLGVKSVPVEIGRLIRDKSEGHPFFAEELAYALRDSGVIIIQNQECRISESFPDIERLSLPDNLQAAITSRIDTLAPPQQLVIKVASVIGRIFAMRVLMAVHPIEADKLLIPDNLNLLTRVGLTLLETEEPDLLYIFKHAVTQEVAYNLMLYSQRRQLHQTIAEWIEHSYERDIASYYPLLAYHWIRAAENPEPALQRQVISKAADYLEKAGEQSLQNFANAEAIQFFTDLLRFKDELQPSRLQLGQWHRKLAMANLGMGKLSEAKQSFLQALKALGRDMPASSLGMVGSLLGQLGRQTGHRLFPKIYRGRITDPEQEAICIEIVQILQEYATVLYLIGGSNPLPLFHSVVTGLNTAESIRETPELAYVYAQMGAICGFIPLRAQSQHYTEQWRAVNARHYNVKTFIGSVISLATIESGNGRWKELRVSLEKVIDICNSLGNHRRAGEAVSFMAANAIIEGNVPLAEEFIGRLLETARKRNNLQLTWCYGWMGTMTLRQGQLDKTLELRDQALAIMEKILVSHGTDLTVQAIGVGAMWHKGEQEVALSEARKLLAQAAKIRVVEYTIYMGFFPFMDVIFLALEQAYEQGKSQAERDDLMKDAKLCVKVMKGFARVFTVGKPITYRYTGWVEWYSGRKERAYQAWRTASGRAHQFPMHYEEGMSYLALGNHLPLGTPERAASFEKAREAFAHGGFVNWAETAQVSLNQ